MIPKSLKGAERFIYGMGLFVCASITCEGIGTIVSAGIVYDKERQRNNAIKKYIKWFDNDFVGFVNLDDYGKDIHLLMNKTFYSKNGNSIHIDGYGIVLKTNEYVKILHSNGTTMYFKLLNSQEKYEKKWNEDGEEIDIPTWDHRHSHQPSGSIEFF